MDILIADDTSPAAIDVARALEAHGHVVRTCRDPEMSGGPPCAALRGAECPLDAHPVDVAVSIGSEAVDHLGDGALCAIRRHIPLVLLDPRNDRLKRWAAAVAPAFHVADAVREVNEAVLPMHSLLAWRTVRDELSRQSLDESTVGVDVRRRDGGLVVDLFVDGSLTRGEAEKLAVHVVQGLRLYDPWARAIDVLLHGTTD